MAVVVGGSAALRFRPPSPRAACRSPLACVSWGRSGCPSPRTRIAQSLESRCGIVGAFSSDPPARHDSTGADDPRPADCIVASALSPIAEAEAGSPFRRQSAHALASAVCLSEPAADLPLSVASPGPLPPSPC